MEQIIKILYVEDNEHDALNFRRELEKSSLHTSLVVVTTLNMGMSLANDEHFDIVFLNYHLPEQSGLTLLRTFRNNGFNVPVIIITNYADPQIAVEMMQSGASDYIPKSLLNTDGIEQCIRNSIRYSELEQERKTVESSLKSAEEKISTIISYTPIILFSLNKQGEFTFAKGKNLGFILPNGEDLIGESAFDLFDGHDEFVNQIKIALMGNEVTQSVKFGDVVYQITCTPRFTENGELDEVVGVANDITKRAEAEESLMKAKILAEQTSKAKQDFIANMSHEIRTPMNAIVGFTNLLEETNLDPLQSDYVKTIQLSGENLLTLINDILDFSKIEAGKLFIEKEEFVLKTVLSSVERVLKGRALEKRLSFSIKYDDDIPPVLLGDSNRLYQVLMNLVSNAIKFTDKGSVKVEVLQIADLGNRVRLKFIVSDTGIGIPKDKYDTIFESFAQVSSGTTRKYGGTGLGLAIVKRLVELQKGNVKVHSKLNEGSVFEFELKFTKGKEKTILSTPTNIVKENIDLSILKHKKVLLAEDNRMNQKLVQNIFDSNGITLLIASNGKEAVDILEKEKIDVLLLDIQMPIMDGFEVTRKIRDTFPDDKKNIPIVAMTAHAFKEEREACFKVGMNDHVAKPINKEELLRAVCGVLQGFTGGIKEESIFNVSYLKTLSEGNDEFVVEMLTIFTEDTPVLIEQMQEAIENEDWRKVSQLSHKYRSPLGLLGIKELEDLMKTIEYDAKEKRNLKELKTLFIKAQELTLQVLKSIHEELSKIKMKQ